jgi:glycerate dehydrogenase
MKIVILDGYALNPGDLDYGCLQQFGEVTVYDRTDSEEEAIQRIGNADILLLNKFPITESLLEKCPSIKLICVQATGYNVVDCAAARKRNIPVCNVPCYGTDAVAQFTMALLLEICHQVGHHDRMVHQGKWCESEIFCFWDTPQMELAGKTMGIIGFGRIGQAVGRLANAFGMKVIAHSRTEYPEGAKIAEYVTLEELYARSDIISLHCPQTPETAGMINRASIHKMKDGVVLLNTSRGGLLVEPDVADALKSGKIRFAAADVVSAEPMKADNPLLSAPNCIITPHMAWAPVESRQRLLDCIVENIRAWLKGTAQNVVN